jgi:WD40 repeat protein
LIQGEIIDQAWTDDSARIAGVGEGKDIFAKAVVATTGSKAGDLNGPTKELLSVAIRPKPYRLVMGGANHDIFAYDGVPFKYTKTLNVHSHFVNALAFSKDGS